MRADIVPLIVALVQQVEACGALAPMSFDNLGALSRSVERITATGFPVQLRDIDLLTKPPYGSSLSDLYYSLSSSVKYFNAAVRRQHPEGVSSAVLNTPVEASPVDNDAANLEID